MFRVLSCVSLFLGVSSCVSLFLGGCSCCSNIVAVVVVGVAILSVSLV